MNVFASLVAQIPAHSAAPVEQEIVRLRLLGYSHVEIATQVHRGLSSVSNVLRKHGIGHQTFYRDRITELIAENATLRARRGDKNAKT